MNMNLQVVLKDSEMAIRLFTDKTTQPLLIAETDGANWQRALTSQALQLLLMIQFTQSSNTTPVVQLLPYGHPYSVTVFK